MINDIKVKIKNIIKPNIIIAFKFLESLKNNQSLDDIKKDIKSNIFKNQIVNEKELFVLVQKELELTKEFFYSIGLIDNQNKLIDNDLLDYLLSSFNLFEFLKNNNNQTLLDLINDDFNKQLSQLPVKNKKESLIIDLKEKGVINNITNDAKLNELLKSNKCAYVGFDPSADSLHLGNFVMINLVNILNKYGIKTYPMVGGATGMIGDPSGKSQERNLLDKNKVVENKNKIINQLKNLTKSDLIIDNIENYENMYFLDFLRDVGKLINVNYMLEKDVIKSRLDIGISFSEFSYTLIQGYDFLQFYKKYNVALQIGGSDQWGNITTGVEMIRKEIGDQNLATGITINLLLKSDGTKFGKSENGAIFLDINKTSAYEMYQFLINQSDDDVIKLFDFITQISNFERFGLRLFSNNIDIKKNRIIQKSLTKYMIEFIHNEKEYENAAKIAISLFSNDFTNLSINELDIAFNNADMIEMQKDKVTNIVDFLIDIKACNSKRESRELIEGNSISINNNKINSLEHNISVKDALHNKYLIVKKGKKHNFIIVFK